MSDTPNASTSTSTSPAQKPFTIEDMAAFCKRKGFVYSSAEIYGGFAGFFDHGPLGTELVNNIKQQWWRFFVQRRDDVVGLDGAIITHPKVWVASGHAANFDDPILFCKKGCTKERADQYLERVLKQPMDGKTIAQMDELVATNKMICANCKQPFEPITKFCLMLTTQVGPSADSSARAFLRPETAQLIFSQFSQISQTNRVKLPFGIAQIGKAFRNEIAPRNFLFRVREFEQAEIEYFIHPQKMQVCPYFEEYKDYVLELNGVEQQQNNLPTIKLTIAQALAKGIFKNPWHPYFLALGHKWFTMNGIRGHKLRCRQHLPTERAHYSTDCWDLEYEYPFGWKEIWGIADRSNYDLTQHQEHSKKDLSLFDEETKSRVLPVVIEPSLGIGRTFLAFMFDALSFDEQRQNHVLRLSPRLAPVTVGVFPLMKKDGLADIARSIHHELREEFVTQYDESGTVGKRYARADEQGTPFCIVVDYQTKEDNTVTIRDRDSTKQMRVAISDLQNDVRDLINGKRRVE